MILNIIFSQEPTVELLYGDAVPCGKLAETYPIKAEHNPASLNFPRKDTAVYEEGIFVGYRYYEKKKLAVRFPFGYGMSYTSFEYSNLKLSMNSATDEQQITVTADVKNTGKYPGKEIVQLYVRDVESSVSRPDKELKGFCKVSLKPGETREVSFVLDKGSFAYYDVELHDWFVESGAFEILFRIFQ